MLAACLTVAYAPAAYAANGNTNTSLAAGTILTTQATKAKTTPKPKKVSAIKLSSKKAGKATISWKASKVKGLTKQTYTVRYAYNKAMKNAKTKTVKAKKLNLSKLTQGKKLYVQIRTNAKYKNKTLHSKWSAKKTVTVKKTAASKTKTNPGTKTQPTTTPTPTTPAAITAPTNLTLSAGSAGQVKATWASKFAQGSFDVRYAYNSNMTNAQTKTVDNKSTGTNSVLLTNLTHLRTLYVQVRYKSNGNVSNWTSVKSIKVPGTWVPEQGHWEPIYTTIVDQEAYTTTTRIYHTIDGWSGSDREEARAHHAMAGDHIGWEDIEEYHPAITHQEQTGQQWVVDVPGHWE